MGLYAPQVIAKKEAKGSNGLAGQINLNFGGQRMKQNFIGNGISGLLVKAVLSFLKTVGGVKPHRLFSPDGNHLDVPHY